MVKQKLINYVDARNGKRDYDVIYYNSDVEGKSNALLNLETFDLKIEGVAKIALSDSQQVYIYPKNPGDTDEEGPGFHISPGR